MRSGTSPADDEQARHRGRLLRELETARNELKGMETRSFSILAREGHDELMSLAGYPRVIVAYAAATTPPPPVSQVIPPEEDYRPHTGDDRTHPDDGVQSSPTTRRDWSRCFHASRRSRDPAALWSGPALVSARTSRTSRGILAKSDR